MEASIILSLNSIPDRNLWKDSFMRNYSKTCSSQVKQHPSSDSPLFVSLSLITKLFVFVIYGGWGHIPCRAVWIRADRPGNHRPFRALISVPSCTVTNSSKTLNVYLTVARHPSVWDCSEFYCLVLFTVLTGHTIALFWYQVEICLHDVSICLDTRIWLISSSWTTGHPSALM